MHRDLSTPALTLAAALLTLGGSAHADVMLVQQTTAGGELAKRLQKQGGSTKPSTVTIYYKANRTRTETEGRVMIFDGQRTLLLNPEKKTYQVVAKDSAAGAANPMLAMMDIKADVSVKPTGKSQFIQGKKAQQFIVTMTMKMSMKSTMKDTPKSKASATESEPPNFPAFTSKMELWTAEFSGVSLSVAAASQAMPAGMGSMPFVKDIAQKMKTIKGIPLLTTMDQNVMGRQITATMRTTSLSESPLPDSLFTLPPGYKQIPYEAPNIPMMPGN